MKKTRKKNWGECQIITIFAPYNNNNMKKVDPNEIHTFQIDLKQYVNEIKWDSHLKEYMHGNQTKIKYGCIEFTGTLAEVNAFLDKMPDNDTQFKLIGVTNLSDVLIDVVPSMVDIRTVYVNCNDQQKVTGKSILEEMFMDSADAARMEANFSHGQSFRTWIRRKDFESLKPGFDIKIFDKLKELSKQ